MAKGVLMSWSGGEDSALALHEVIRGTGYEIKALLTTVTADFDRMSMHGVRRSLLHAQASSWGSRSRRSGFRRMPRTRRTKRR